MTGNLWDLRMSRIGSMCCCTHSHLMQSVDAVVPPHAARDVQHQHRAAVGSGLDQRETGWTREWRVGRRVQGVIEIRVLPQNLQCNSNSFQFSSRWHRSPHALCPVSQGSRRSFLWNTTCVGLFLTSKGKVLASEGRVLASEGTALAASLSDRIFFPAIGAVTLLFVPAHTPSSLFLKPQELYGSGFSWEFICCHFYLPSSDLSEEAFLIHSPVLSRNLSF